MKNCDFQFDNDKQILNAGRLLKIIVLWENGNTLLYIIFFKKMK